MTPLTAPTHVARTAQIHPVWLRATHWLNALAVLLMMASGWRVYNAAPLFGFRFPRDFTLGGWLGGHCNGTSQACGCWPSMGSFTSR
jgi:Thiosulfate reductase cytochrome B subunit (membrane anchoring protein)